VELILEKFQNKYRIPSARLQSWDYRSSAPYFVTICTAQRKCFFGTIRNGEMNLSDIGEIVVDEWKRTPVIRPDMNLIMDVFVVMPDHCHGIIFIGKNRYNRNMNNINDGGGRDAMHGAPTYGLNTKNKFGPQVKNLASIIRGFKSAVTVNARKINPDFAWQPRFHDHIIKDDRSYERIRKYIIDNPKNWEDDKSL
jgi:REP element-mobilizing transposase RayT